MQYWNLGYFGILLAIASSMSTIRSMSSEEQEESFCIPSSANFMKQCPSGKIEWTKAANAKNCSKFHSLHSNLTFVYHCLINEWANATVEVCARRVHVLFGKCAEYNFGAKRIQSSERKLCNRTDPPCPNVYNSTDAYKYQSCYDFSTVGKPLEIPTNVSTETKSSVTFSSPQHHTNANENLTIIILTAVLLCVTVFVVSFIIVIKWYKSRQNSEQRDSPADHDEETNAFIAKQ